MINIILDDSHRITSDAYQYILQEKKVIVGGDREGEEYYTVKGYYPTINSALHAYKELQIRKSDADSVKKLIEMIKKLDQMIDEILTRED